MTKTEKILIILSKKPLTANKLLAKLKIKYRYDKKFKPPPNIRSILYQLLKQGRIRKTKKIRPYEYVTVKSDADLKFLYKIMNNDMDPNKEISKINIDRIKRIERMIK